MTIKYVIPAPWAFKMTITYIIPAPAGELCSDSAPPPKYALGLPPPENCESGWGDR